jgi:hypothetical protein
VSRLDHAAAHEYLADLALEPGRLAGLGTSPDASDEALRQHLGGCPSCQADFEEWGRVQQALADALVDADEASPSAALPPALRDGLLASIQRPAAPGVPGAPRRSGTDFAARPAQRLALAAAAAIVLLAMSAGVVVIRDQNARLEAASAQNAALVELADVLGRVLTAADQKAVVLLTADGRSGGQLAWTRREVVVLSRALSEPGAGHYYRCWVIRDGEATSIGRLYFAGGWAFWAGSTDDWATIDFRPGGAFVVSLEQAGPAAERPAGPIVLHADLGS